MMMNFRTGKRSKAPPQKKKIESQTYSSEGLLSDILLPIFTSSAAY